MLVQRLLVLATSQTLGEGRFWRCLLLCRGRGGEFVQPGGQVNGLADVCLMGLGVGGNYVWCLAIVVIFMRTGGAKRWGAGGSVLKPIFEVANHDGGGSFYVGISRYVILLFWNFIASLTGYRKSYYRIPLFTTLLLFYLLCIYWDMKN